jgi:hypothetical protein
VNETEEHAWMPVFIVKHARQSYQAAHPDEKTPVQPSETTTGNDYLVRVGSATRQDDGSYTIHLWALPVDGTLFMRRPLPGEQFDPTLAGGK